MYKLKLWLFIIVQWSGGWPSGSWNPTVGTLSFNCWHCNHSSFCLLWTGSLYWITICKGSINGLDYDLFVFNIAYPNGIYNLLVFLQHYVYNFVDQQKVSSNVKDLVNNIKLWQLLVSVCTPVYACIMPLCFSAWMYLICYCLMCNYCKI